MNFNIIRLKENKGHGISRAAAIEHSNYNLVFIMDSDDIALPTRCESTIAFYNDHPEMSVIGGQISEFMGDETNIIGFRKVLLNHLDIVSYLKFRCPFNQVTVMLKKDDVISVGGYQEWYCDEDYYLWLRMYKAGMQFANIPDVLVNVRVGKEMYARRGGWKYFVSEARLQKYMLKEKIITVPIFAYNLIVRFIAQVICPNQLRNILFKFVRVKQSINHSNHANSEGKKIQNSFPFSVAMNVYKNDNPEYFDKAIDSMINQTLEPSELTLVVDGPITEGIEIIIQKYKEKYNGSDIYINE